MSWHRCFVCADNRKLCSSSDRKNGRQCSCAEPDLFGGICKDGRICIFDGKGKAVAENEEKLPDTTDTEQWERLLFLTKYLTEILKEHGITAITLKGASTASFYPVPELRKSGDVDILITDAAKCEQACRGGLFVKRTSAYDTSWGFPIYQPPDGYHAFYLILHMLQHYLRAGFGIKNLCDWVVFWNREIDKCEQENFLRLMRESGTTGFVQIMTAACVEYLGLPKERVNFFLTKEIPQRQTEQMRLFEMEQK